MLQLSPHAIDMVKDPSTISAYSLQSLAILRDPHQFKWQVITLFLLVLYVYQSQISKKNWSVVLGGLALWGCDWFNEIWNGLVFYFTQYAPVWGTPGNETSYLILIGLNIEITMMFAVMGVVACLALPAGQAHEDLRHPQPAADRHRLYHRGRDRGDDFKCHGRAHVGICLVEPQGAVAALAHRVFLLLCRGLLGP